MGQKPDYKTKLLLKCLKESEKKGLLDSIDAE